MTIFNLLYVSIGRNLTADLKYSLTGWSSICSAGARVLEQVYYGLALD